MWPFRKKQPETEPQTEQRASMQGYTSDLIAAREAYLSGTRGLGELTGTVQSCVGHWENGLSLADVTGTALLNPQLLAGVARSLALRGEAVLLLSVDSLIPVSDWDLSTQYGKPKSYRLSIPEIGGGRKQIALASEVLHFRIGQDLAAPWTGSSPLSRSALTGQLLEEIEEALTEVYGNAPIGTQVIPFPENPETDLQKLGAGFRGKRGRVLLRESVNVTAAGGPVPQTDWRPIDTTPNLKDAMTAESLGAARDSILAVYGILPALFDTNTTGPLVREAQRHLAQWHLQPIANQIAHEASEKLDVAVSIDVMKPLQAFDAGARARTVAQVIAALAQAKEAGINPAQALELVNWASSE